MDAKSSERGQAALEFLLVCLFLLVALWIAFGAINHDPDVRAILDGLHSADVAFRAWWVVNIGPY